MAKVYVICGHGAGDSGACGNGFKEAEQVRKLGKRIKALGGNNVILGNVSRNFYKDDGISKLTISKEYKIIELHMDSSTSASAKGAHVIIKEGYSADQYDIALANFLCDMFPGRSKKIDGRDNLANVNRAARKGYNYRLVECGFISNADDAKRFNENIDNIAKGILTCFGIKFGESTPDTKPADPKPNPAPSKPAGNTGSSYYPKFNSTSIVDGLKSIGVSNSMANRKKIAAANGISGYVGSASQNEKLLSLAKQGKLKKAGTTSTASKPTTSYYPKFNSTSIVDGLKSIGVSNSMANRKKIAKANGILNYAGTASQNEKLLLLARQGKLKKA